MIDVSGLRYRYPGGDADALAGVTVSIDDAESVVIAGESGSGKSTLARALVGLVPHFHGGTIAGRVSVFGRDTRTTPPRELADLVGFVPQDPAAQAVAERVEDEIAFTMENLGIPPMLMRKRMEEVLDALGLAEIRGRALESLSGGERQRVAIASVLTAQPRALILDEPTSQLDPQSAEEVLAVLHRLNADLGMTIVLVEHRLERVVQHADRLVVMAEGRIVADGSPREVLAGGTVATPLSRLALGLSWEPVPLTVKEGRAFASRLVANVASLPPREQSTGTPLIDAAGLRVARGKREVVRGVDLLVRGGETVAVVGRNGAGKTTLLRALIGLTRTHAGRRTIAGFDAGKTPVEQIASRVAYLPQSADSILFHESVRNEIAFTLKARGRDDVEQVLASAGLETLSARDPADLSAGQRLQVAMLAVTAGDPDVLLLDEPTRGMDAAAKDAFASRCRAWRADERAVVVVTHDVELIARIATRVVLIADGEVVVDGAVRDVLGGSPLFSSQMNKVFGDPTILTVEDALASLGTGAVGA